MVDCEHDARVHRVERVRARFGARAAAGEDQQQARQQRETDGDELPRPPLREESLLSSSYSAASVWSISCKRPVTPPQLASAGLPSTMRQRCMRVVG